MRLHNLRALHENIAHLGIHEQIDITLAISKFDVLQAMPLFGQGKQVLGEERNLFARARSVRWCECGKVALRADVIADIEQLEQLKLFFADIVFLHVDLQALTILLEVHKSGLAHQANGHDASRDLHLNARRFQLGALLFAIFSEHLRNQVSEFVLIWVSLLTPELRFVPAFCGGVRKYSLRVTSDFQARKSALIKMSANYGL